MRPVRSFAVAALALAAAFGAVPIATAGPAAPVARYNCPSGYFCIYSDWNGGGTVCKWSQPEMRNTADNCSFIRSGSKVRSVWNGTSKRKQYYTDTNFHSRVGSTKAVAGGNLQGSYQIRSFKPQ